MAGNTKKDKVTVNVVFKDETRLMVHVILPPGSSTGFHPEKADYFIIPLTSGTLHADIVRTVRGKEQRQQEAVKLKLHQRFHRKVGRGIRINGTNKGNRTLHIFKDYRLRP